MLLCINNFRTYAVGSNLVLVSLRTSSALICIKYCVTLVVGWWKRSSEILYNCHCHEELLLNCLHAMHSNSHSFTHCSLNVPNKYIPSHNRAETWIKKCRCVNEIAATYIPRVIDCFVVHFSLVTFNMGDNKKCSSCVPEMDQKCIKPIPLKNYLTDEVFYDTLHAEADRVW